MWKWLNPINWIKSAVASAIDEAIDENITFNKGRTLLIDGINLAVTASEKKWTDDECRSFARGCRLAATAMHDIADAIDPDGVEGRKISVDEFNVILGDAQSAFGTLIDEEKVEDLRAKLKSIVHSKLGI